MDTGIYLRVSTDEQVANGYGLDAQRSKCHAMAEVKEWDIVREFSDEGISGTLDESDRPGLSAILDAIEAGEINAVIVSALDRLGRSTRLVLRMVEAIEGGADLISCKESLDTSTASGRFVLRMFASLAELERETITERLTAGRNARGRKDGERGGWLPLGYKRTIEGPVIVPEEAEIVIQIFELRADGRVQTEIAKILNSQGSITRRGKQWGQSSVSVVLKNKDAYRGGYRWESKVRWPGILE